MTPKDSSADAIPDEVLQTAAELFTAFEAPTVEEVARAIMAAEDRQREKDANIAYDRAKDSHRQAKRYEATGDETSQGQCLIAAVEAMDCAAAIRGGR